MLGQCICVVTDAAAIPLPAEDAALLEEPPAVVAAVLPDTEPAAEAAAAAVPPVPQLEYRAEPLRTVQPSSPPRDAAALRDASTLPAVGLPVASTLFHLRSTIADLSHRARQRPLVTSMRQPKHATACNQLLQ